MQPPRIHAAAAAGGPAASITPKERHRKRSPGQPGCGALFQMLRRLRNRLSTCHVTFNLKIGTITESGAGSGF